MTAPVYTASHWGGYEVETANGKVTRLSGLPNDPEPSAIGQGWIDTLDDRCRIARPMVRKGYLENGWQSDTGGRGKEAFVPVSWDEAERLLAAELDRVRVNHGNEAIFAGSYGWASAGRLHNGPAQLHRFMNCIGGFTSSVNTYSFAAGEVILPHVLGPLYPLLPRHAPWKSIAENADLVVAFGGLPLKNGQVNMQGCAQHTQTRDQQAARAAGVRFVNVSPIRSDTAAALEADWLAIRPNTDVALMLGLAHTLVEEDLHDRAFLESHCVGYDRFHAYLTGLGDACPKSASWAGAITGIDATAIRELARSMANGRTMISLSWSLTRRHHGEQPFWAGVALAAMLGHIGLPGGGVGFGYSAINGIGHHTAPVPWASMDRGKNPVASFIPVARIADLLLHPGERFDYNGKSHQYPDIRLVYWVGGNPFHHHQDLNRLVRAWRRPETVVVHEIWWNPLARHADIVLPATTPLERNDIVAPPRDGVAIACRRAVDPIGEARDDFRIFKHLAARLGVQQAFTEGRDEMDWLRHLYDVSRQRAAREGFELPSFDTFWAQGLFEAPSPSEPQCLFAAFRATPDSHPLPTPSGKIELYSRTIEGFGYDDCPPHPTWMEPVEWLGSAGAERFPLHLLCNQPRTRLHSQLDNGSVSRAGKVNEREPLTMNQQDAAVRGIKQHATVVVFNDRGECLASALLSDDILPGVVQIATGAWFDPEPAADESLRCKHGNPNVLTLDHGTSKLSQGPSAHSCLVDVRPLQGTAPAVTAFDPPDFSER